MQKKTTKKARTTKATKQPKAKAAKPTKPMSGLDAAAKVLGEAKEPMSAKQIVETALAKGLWKTSGATPWATIYSAMIREIAVKGKEARFKKVARGRFTAA
ncbi:MAG: hypothetical protein GC159_14440 [Phycisphaera sp.]|nr:hypothetical protein [Phycisphaera sp.]